MSEASTVAEAMICLDHAAAVGGAGWLLLDLMLPDGCGLDVLKKIRHENLPTRTCIVTGCAGELLLEARHAGAEHTFIKPLDVDRLVHVMTATPAAAT